MRYLFLTALFTLSVITFSSVTQAGQGDDHGVQEQQSEQSHDDTTPHNDHGEEADEHDQDGHEEHQGLDEHDDHGHAAEQNEAHEESGAQISPGSAALAGVQTQTAGPAQVAVTIPLTGRIVLNENKSANVRARFPGFVKQVHVNLGDMVKQGDKLATVESNESLRNYVVTAPIDGVVLKRETNIGDVTNGKELFVIADLSSVWAKYHVFPRDIAKIKKEQSVSVHTLDEKTNQTAEVSMLFPTADALSQTVIAIAELSNDNGIWRPGMTVEGDVKISEESAAIAVPKTALQFLEDKQVVFVKNGNRYEPRPVTTGTIGIDNVEITSGLQNGETYVSAGSFVIKADILKATAAHSH